MASSRSSTEGRSVEEAASDPVEDPVEDTADVTGAFSGASARAGSVPVSVSAMYDLVVGKSVSQALETGDHFMTLMQAKGDPSVAEKLEDELEDAVAFAGVSKYPARIKCALMSWMALKDASARALSVGTTATGGTA